MFGRENRGAGSAQGRLTTAAALIVGVLVAGSVGYTLLGLSAVDSLYQTIVTVSTVGFREIADGDPDNTWKLFTSVLILVGAGSMLYGATIVIESIVEGRITGQFRRYRMQRAIDELSGHLIVCGMGRVGRSITSFVQSVGQAVVAVDHDVNPRTEPAQHVVVLQLEHCRHHNIGRTALRAQCESLHKQKRASATSRALTCSGVLMAARAMCAARRPR